jgi:hypothetical protein
MKWTSSLDTPPFEVRVGSTVERIDRAIDETGNEAT